MLVRILWKITKLPSQHSMLGHHPSVRQRQWRFAGGPKFSMALSCRGDDGPLLMVVWYSLPSSRKKKLGPPWQNFLDPRMLIVVFKLVFWGKSEFMNSLLFFKLVTSDIGFSCYWSWIDIYLDKSNTHISNYLLKSEIIWYKRYSNHRAYFHTFPFWHCKKMLWVHTPCIQATAMYL